MAHKPVLTRILHCHARRLPLPRAAASRILRQIMEAKGHRLRK